jgi:uncharacterized protein
MSYCLIDPEELKKMAEKAEKSSLQWVSAFNKKQANKLDDKAQELHYDIFNEIDCLKCANCCKSISPTLYDMDIERLSRFLKLKPSEFIEKYLKIDEDKDYVFRQTPCPFLDSENYCLVYENRPKACREYPHTNRARFYQILKLTVKNSYVCPTAYYVMEELKK